MHANHHYFEQGTHIVKRLGIISDTHGILRKGVLSVFKGTDLILHAGDIGHSDVITGLRSVAKVVAVRGNMDRGNWAASYQPLEVVEIAGRTICVIHDLETLDLEPAGGFDLVVHGHTHRPSRFVRDGVLYFNPGSAGPARSGRPVSVGLVEIHPDSIDATVVEIDSLPPE